MARKVRPDKQLDVSGCQTALEFLLRCATPEVLSTVRERLCADPEKLALMIVRALNPVESLTNDEEGALRGMNRHTVGKLKSEGQLPMEPHGQ